MEYSEYSNEYIDDDLLLEGDEEEEMDDEDEKALLDEKLDAEARVRAQAKLYRALVRIGSANRD